MVLSAISASEMT